jgi:DNA-binding IclR family transcriptional regulator
MNEHRRNKGADAVKSADRVLDLFELLSGWGHEISHSDIAATLNIPKGSLTKLLQNLIARGYVDYSPINKGYRLGHIFTRLVEQASQSRNLLSLIAPILQDLTAQTNESSTLNQLRGFKSVVIATVSSPMRLVPHMRVGDIGPLYALSGGKCMLAAMPDAMVNEYMSQVVFEQVTPKTISSTTELWREIAKVRQSGVAFSLEEFTPGISGIGVAILSETGFPLGSLTLAIPTVRFTPAAKELGVAALKAAAERIRVQHLTRLVPAEKRPALVASPRQSNKENSQKEKAAQIQKRRTATKPIGAGKR